MSKNPFQILDFLGYFFPGATVLIALYYSVPSTQEFITITDNTSAIIYIVCIILAYIVGHIVSLLSSITVEKYAVWRYGYPSEFLLIDYEPHQYLSRSNSLDSTSLSKKRTRFLSVAKSVFKVIVWIGLLPVSLLDVVLSLFFGVDYYYTRKLSGQQINMIRGKCDLLFNSIGIQEEERKLFDGDNHRVIHNYYYEKDSKHSARMDSCIAIYDYLRSMTFVVCVIFMIEFVRSLLTLDIKLDVDYKQIGALVSLAILSYVFFMGFLKFYRKFTIENFMCLICDKDFDFPRKKESNLIRPSNGVQLQSDNQHLTVK